MNPNNAPQEHSVHPAELAAECKRLVHRYADRRIDAYRGYDGLAIATVEAECLAAIDRLAALAVAPVHPAETALEPSCAGGLGHPAGSPSREHAAEAGSSIAAEQERDKYRNGNTHLLGLLMKLCAGEHTPVLQEARNILLASDLMRIDHTLDWGALEARKPKQQTWEEAVRECVTDPAEVERLLALDDEETEPASGGAQAAEAARPDVEEEASAPQAVPLPVAKVVEQEFDYPWRTKIAPFGLSVAQCQEKLPVGTLLYLAGQIAEAPTVSGLTDEQIDEAAHELQRVIGECGGESTECAYDYLRGILAKLPALCERLPEASGSDVKEAAAEPSSAPKEKP